MKKKLRGNNLNRYRIEEVVEAEEDQEDLRIGGTKEMTIIHHLR